MKRKFMFVVTIIFLLILAACKSQALITQPQTPSPSLQPQEVVKAFYTEWIEQANQRFLDDGPNALAARDYRKSPYLTAALITTVDKQLDTELPMGGADPFFCAQDIPSQVDVISTVLLPPEAAGPVLPPSARTLLKTSFADHYLAVCLIKEDNNWKIDHITCNLTPEGTVEAFYTWYLGAIGIPGSENFHNPIQEGTFRTSGFLSPKLIADIDAIVASFDTKAAYDPFLLAQNIPLDFYVSPSTEDNTILLHQVWGTEEHILKITLVENKGRWQMDSIGQQ